MANNNEYMYNFLNSIKKSNDLSEKKELRKDYNKRYNESKEKIINGFMYKNLPILPCFEDNTKNHEFTPSEFIKALSLISDTDAGRLKILYMLKVLMELSKNTLPFNPEEFIPRVMEFENDINDIIEYGIKNNIIKIHPEDEEILSKGKSEKSIISHIEASMESDEEKKSNDKKSKDVEKESAKDKKEEEDKKKKENKKEEEDKKKKENKKEEDKKKKEEKKKKNEENRNDTKKWFDYDSLNTVQELKENKAPWYKVANRIATLLIQEEVQKIITEEKFKLLIYQNSEDFAIINEINTRIFWFKKGEVEHFTDANMFNIKWAEVHQPQDTKFTA